MGSLLGTLRNPKVAALVVGGLVALVISFVVPTSPETVTLVHGRPYHSSETHPIDVALTFCRFLGSLSLVVGICAMFAYRRGEMDVPHEACAARGAHDGRRPAGGAAGEPAVRQDAALNVQRRGAATRLRCG